MKSKGKNELEKGKKLIGIQKKAVEVEMRKLLQVSVADTAHRNYYSLQPQWAHAIYIHSRMVQNLFFVI